jgi:hypothetical protein
MKRKVFLAVLLVSLCALRLPAIDRGLGNPRSVYIPKGTVSLSLAGGYNSWEATGEDLDKGVILAGLIDEVNGDVSLIKASAGASWFFADNWSLGMRFGFAHEDIDVNNLALLSLINLSNKHIRRETYTGALAVRNYMPLFDSKILALFFEGRLTGSFGYGKNYAETDRGKEGRYSDLYSAKLGLYPGISVFATDRVSFEFSLPILEGGFEWDKQIKGQAHDSALSRRFIQFKPGLTGISAGIVFHF